METTEQYLEFFPAEALYQVYRQHPVVCTDTRQLTTGCIFFALTGENFDGNQFALQALESGAAYCVVDDAQLFNQHARLLLVADVLESLQTLATRRRKDFDIPVIAIGGSNGKTTTKELLTAVMSSHYPCHATKGNFNNHIGVPITLLAMPEDTEVAIIEMGTNQPGDIQLLCQIAEPTHGLLTNIGKEHLAGFGSIEGVKKAEGELFEYLQSASGCAFVNRSERYLTAMAREIAHRVDYARVAVLLPNDPGVIGVELAAETPFVRVAFLSDADERTTAQTQLLGVHNFNNIMTAIALGLYFKVPPERIKTALENYRSSNNRSQLVQRGTNTIFLDAYNANPSSMMPALETLRKMKGTRKVAMLGDMLELGDDSLAEHEAIVQFANQLQFDRLILVGPEFGRTAYQAAGALHFPDAPTARAWFQEQHFEHTDFLVKGSRGIRMETIVNE